MEAKDLSNRLEVLEVKVNKLLDVHREVKKQLQAALQENEKLKTTIKEKDKQLDDFQYNLKISTIVEHLGINGEDSLELKSKIDDYIKDIDNCISYLNSQL